MSAGGAHKEDLQGGGNRPAGRVHLPGVRKVSHLIYCPYNIYVYGTICPYFFIISSVMDLLTVPVRPMITLFLTVPACSPIDTSQRKLLAHYRRNRGLGKNRTCRVDFENVRDLRVPQLWGRGKQSHSLYSCYDQHLNCRCH